MTQPDFLLIGAMKCATTTLQQQLAAQTGVFMTTPKEPNYFSDDAVYAQGADWYGRLFDTAQPGDLRGEASTHYTKRPTHPHTIDRIKAAGLTPKLIYMIRNPVDRAMSHYIHEWSKGIITDDPHSALQTHPELIDYGRYGWQITPYVEAFGLSQIYLTSLEQIKADPEGELASVGRFLGLTGPLHWDTSMGAQNTSADRYKPLPFSRLLVDNPVARVLRRTIVPKGLRERVRHARAIRSHPELSPEAIAQLRTHFSEDRTILAEYFPDHPALKLCYPALS